MSECQEYTTYGGQLLSSLQACQIPVIHVIVAGRLLKEEQQNLLEQPGPERLCVHARRTPMNQSYRKRKQLASDGAAENAPAILSKMPRQAFGDQVGLAALGFGGCLQFCRCRTYGLLDTFHARATVDHCPHCPKNSLSVWL